MSWFKKSKEKSKVEDKKDNTKTAKTAEQPTKVVKPAKTTATKKVSETKSSKPAETKKVAAKQPVKKAEPKNATAKSSAKVSNAKKPVEKQPTAKAPAKQEEKLGAYRVIYDKDDRLWKIKRDGAKRVITSMPTKEEALKRVDELSQSQDVRVVVHKKDGKFQKR